MTCHGVFSLDSDYWWKGMINILPDSMCVCAYERERVRECVRVCVLDYQEIPSNRLYISLASVYS